MPTLGASYRWTCIDCSPLAGEVAKSAILASDLIVIPLQPSGTDKWSMENILTLITEARFYKPNAHAVMVVNRKSAGTAIGKTFRQGIETDYPDFPVRCFRPRSASMSSLPRRSLPGTLLSRWTGKEVPPNKSSRSPQKSNKS